MNLVVFSVSLVLACAALTDGTRGTTPLTPEVALAPRFSRVPLLGGVSGDVIVIGVVGVGGSITEPAVENGHVALHYDSLEAAKGWRFAAAEVGADVRLVFSFSSLPANSKEKDSVLFYPPNRVEVRRKRPRPPDPY
jgi:hypothetical protein